MWHTQYHVDLLYLIATPLPLQALLTALRPFISKHVEIQFMSSTSAFVEATGYKRVLGDRDLQEAISHAVPASARSFGKKQ